MKIKCPSCAALLQIPDSAAGKVIQCKCGKQLRAPDRSGVSASKPASFSAASAGLFDELTDADLSGIKAVQMPGAAVPKVAASGNANKMLNEAMNAGAGGTASASSQGLAPRPGFLIFVAVVNAFWTFVCFLLAMLALGLMAAFPMLAGEIPAEEGTVLTVLGVAFVLIGLMSLATCLACVIRSKVSWYVILLSYSWGFADRVMEVVRTSLNDQAELNYGKIVGGILVGLGIWAYMHGEDVRAFYQTEKEPWSKIIAANAAGLAVGIALGVVIIMM